MNRKITAVALGLALITSAAGATIPQIRQGMEYKAARSLLIDHGWQANIISPMQKDELQNSLQEWFIKRNFDEITYCYPTGSGRCTAIFHNHQGDKLYLFTSGEPDDEYPPKVISWCINKPEINCSKR